MSPLPISELNVIAPTGRVRFGTPFRGLGAAAISELGDPFAGVGNPAALDIDAGVAFAVEASWRPGTRYLGLLSLDSVDAIPGFAAFAVHVPTFDVQFGYARTYDDLRVTDPIIVTNETNPEGVGSYVRVRTFTRVEAMFAAISFRLRDDLRIGFSASMDNVSHGSSGLFDMVSTAGRRFTGSAGLIFVATERIYVGATARFATDATLRPSRALYPFRGGDSSRVPSGAILSPAYVAKEPTVVTAGMSWKVLEAIEVRGGAEHTLWSGSHAGARDIWHVQAGATIRATHEIALRADLSFEPYNYSASEEYFDQTFASVGVEVSPLTGVAIGFSWRSSELFARDDVTGVFGSPSRSLFQRTISGGITVLF